MHCVIELSQYRIFCFDITNEAPFHSSVVVNGRLVAIVSHVLHGWISLQHLIFCSIGKSFKIPKVVLITLHG